MSLLAEHYEKEGRWPDALRAWQACRLYGAGCGNAFMAAGSERLRRMIRCHRKLDDDAGLARTFTEVLATRRSLELGDRLRVAAALFDLYRQAGQLDDLPGIIDDIEREILSGMDPKDLTKPEKLAQIKEFYRITLLRKLVGIYKDGRLPAVPELVRLCAQGKEPDETPGRGDWGFNGVCEFASEALACHGEEAVPAILEAIRDIPDDGSGGFRRQPIRPGKRNRLIYALGRNRSPEALVALRELAEAGRKSDGPAITHALAMKGQDGADVLQVLANKSGSPLASLASEWFEVLQEGEWVESPGRQIRRGSLPQEVALSGF